MTHSRSINERDLLIYLCRCVHLMCECVSACSVFVCVFTTMCNDIQSKLWNITYKAWFMSHFKLVFRWFWLIYRSFSYVMPLLPSPRQLCTHIAENHEHTSNKCSVFQLPFNNGTCMLDISHVSLLLQGVYTVNCVAELDILTVYSKSFHCTFLALAELILYLLKNFVRKEEGPFNNKISKPFNASNHSNVCTLYISTGNTVSHTQCALFRLPNYFHLFFLST